MTTPGVTCIAATVFSHEGLPIAGLGVAVDHSESNPSSHEQLIHEVTETAEELSRAMGWAPERESARPCPPGAWPPSR